jgi:Ca-activated chloride channel family protein
MAEFHFLRPEWLLLAPVGLVLAVVLLRARLGGGGWQKVVEPALQRFVLERAAIGGGRPWPVIVALLATVLAALALAGPTWERQPVPAYRANDALVIAFDLSRSMDATDVTPSRLARAKLKLLSLLERRAGGEIALVVFSSHAFTVTPLTTDARTVASLVGSLSTDIMPSQGSLPATGLAKAADLLRQAGSTGGEILLISDADITDEDTIMARDLRAEGMRTSVLAVGTQEGAPIPDSQGGFVTDRSGQVVVPRLDLSGLREIAQTGGGRFAQLAPDERDLDALFPRLQSAGFGTAEAADGDDYAADVWRDQGIWLALILLPVLALAFRRGWVCALACIWLVAPPRAEAFEWMELWKRADQRGLDAFQSNDAARAAELFEDPQWRGAAEYRAEAYESSAATLDGSASVDGLYNRGNALARAGQLEAAIESYDRALELDPDNEDARYNRDLVAELLEQNQDEQEGEDESQSSQDQQSSDSGDSGEQQQEGESDASQQENQSAQDASDSASDKQQGAQQPSDSQADASGDQSREELADAEQQEEGPPPDGQALPEDIEQWASDQAADQWLRRVPQDPGGLLRRKFLYQYQRMGIDQDGNYVWPGEEDRPW